MSNETMLRESIRSVVKFVKEKRLNEEKQLRKIIREMLDYELNSLEEAQTADTDPSPNKSTGINVLEDLLKKIIPVLETDYKILTTSVEQRNSFRSHVIQAIVQTLKPVEVNNDAAAAEVEDLNEDIEIELTDDQNDDDKFIDIRTKKERDFTGVIPGSLEITAFDIHGKFVPEFMKTFRDLVDLNDNIVFISNQGEIAAILANGFAEQLGAKNMNALKGGIQQLIYENYDLYKK